jgi:hypothetical protein
MSDVIETDDTVVELRPGVMRAETEIDREDDYPYSRQRYAKMERIRGLVWGMGEMDEWADRDEAVTAIDALLGDYVRVVRDTLDRQVEDIARQLHGGAGELIAKYRKAVEFAHAECTDLRERLFCERQLRDVEAS